MNVQQINRLLNVPAILEVITDGPLDEMNMPTEIVADRQICCFPVFNLPAEEYEVAPTPVTAGQVTFRVGTPAHANSRLTVNGVAYEIEGEPVPTFEPKSNTIVKYVATIRRAT